MLCFSSYSSLCKYYKIIKSPKAFHFLERYGRKDAKGPIGKVFYNHHVQSWDKIRANKVSNSRNLKEKITCQRREAWMKDQMQKMLNAPRARFILSSVRASIILPPPPPSINPYKLFVNLAEVSSIKLYIFCMYT